MGTRFPVLSNTIRKTHKVMQETEVSKTKNQKSWFDCLNVGCVWAVY